MKSHFILNYFDDLDLRLPVYKSLKRVELSNKFTYTIFLANTQEFQEALKLEQVIITVYKILI